MWTEDARAASGPDKHNGESWNGVIASKVHSWILERSREKMLYVSRGPKSSLHSVRNI